MVDVKEIINQDENAVKLEGNLSPLGEVSLQDTNADMESVEKIIERVFRLSKEERLMVLMALLDNI